MQVVQEVESHWTSGRALPDTTAAMAAVHHTSLHTCMATINAALACRQRSPHSAQVICCAVDIPQSPEHYIEKEQTTIICHFLFCELLGNEPMLVCIDTLIRGQEQELDSSKQRLL